MAAKTRKPKTKFSDLSPAYKKRLEAAYKAGKFGEGYSSAGRAYAAGASRQVARGQAKTSEAERGRRIRQRKKAQAWSNKHSKAPQTDYKPPSDGTPEQKAKYTDDYLDAMKELEKGWANTKVKNRKQVDWDKVESFFKDHDVDGFDEYFPLV